MKLFITSRSHPALLKGFFVNCSATNLPQHTRITISSSQSSKTLCRFSRRDIAISIISSAPILHRITNTPFKAIAEETNLSQITDPPPTQPPEEQTPIELTTDSPPITKKPALAFLDISIDGQQVGRIKIAISASEAPSGASRFTNLISGKPGVSYRRKEFIKIMPNYIQHGGVRSYGETGVDELVSELERSNENVSGTKNIAGSVGILVRDPSKPPPKMKLVAKRGKLEIDSEEVGVSPNGTEFVISTRDAPELDQSTLVVGRVVDGMDVVERIAQVKTVQENSSSPYFRVAKLIGDKRAIVAERGFNRPYSKIVVTNCGLID